MIQPPCSVKFWLDEATRYNEAAVKKVGVLEKADEVINQVTAVGEKGTSRESTDYPPIHQPPTAPSQSTYHYSLFIHLPTHVILSIHPSTHLILLDPLRRCCDCGPGQGIL